MAAERHFRAMGSDAHVIVVGGPPSLVNDAIGRIEDLEAKWSRFRPDSEVNELNRAAARPVAVSADTVTLVEHAMVAWRISGGSFDPTILGAVVRAGYDRPFEALPGGLLTMCHVHDNLSANLPEITPGHSVLGQGADRIVIAGGTVTLPPGTGFDPGGIGKGLAADLVCAELVAAGAKGACVNLGGDLRVCGSGPGPDGGPWTVAVEHPEAGPFALLGLVQGAVATSTTLRRRWQVDGQARHHLIDPQTGLPSGSDVVLSTVVAGQAWVAEVLAKAVLLAGSAHPFDCVGGTGAVALAVDYTGKVHATPGWSALLGGASLPSLLTIPADHPAPGLR